MIQLLIKDSFFYKNNIYYTKIRLIFNYIRKIIYTKMSSNLKFLTFNDTRKKLLIHITF